MVQVVKEQLELNEAKRKEEQKITNKRMYSPPGVVEEWERTNSEQFWQFSVHSKPKHYMNISCNNDQEIEF